MHNDKTSRMKKAQSLATACQDATMMLRSVKHFARCSRVSACHAVALLRRVRRVGMRGANKSTQPLRTAKRLQQSAFAEIAEIAAGRALHHIDGELEQANFPGVVHTLNHGAERFVCVLHAAFCAIDHCVD